MKLLLTLILLVTTANADSERPYDPAAAFARLKTLVGDWEADTSMGKARISYELIAGGSALVERETMGNMPPMMTVYNLDGNRLVLTHYCMVGNQPRMQARKFDAATGELVFEFLDATNLATPGAGHMHNAKFRLADKDHFNSEWDFYENGKRTKTEAAQYSRVR